MIVEWQKLGWVEAQVFKSHALARAAILFCPGFPGLGGALFEQRHAAALTHAGYDVYVIHHKGTRTNGPLSPQSINNSKRLQDAWESGETHIGGGAVTIDELLEEPLTVLHAIAGKYMNIHVIGNSFGALSALQSLTTQDAPIDNIKSLILLAGAQAVPDDTDNCIFKTVWKIEHMASPLIGMQIEVTDPADALNTLRNVYNQLPRRVIEQLPEQIRLSYIVAEHDQVIPNALNHTRAFQAAIQGRGKIVIEHDRGWPEFFIGAHETPNLRTTQFLELMRG